MQIEQNRVSTGIEGLDDVLGGGLPEGHLYLFEGEPGTGKTTLGLQFLLAGAGRNENAMIVTISESRNEIEDVARSHGWSLDGISIFQYAPGEEALRVEDQYSAFHPSEVEFQDTMQSILQEIERVRPSRIVFDSLAEIRLLARDALRYRRQILAMKHFFANRGCTVMLLDDQTATGKELQSIAHGVVRLERVQREYGIERRRIRIAKIRASRFREGYHDYTIQTGGIAVYPRLVAAEHQGDLSDDTLSSGIAELDALCGGGLTRGTSTLILGPAGTGKSSLAMSYAVSSARREQFTACFLFDETRDSAIRRSAKLGTDPRPLMEAGVMSLDQIDPAEMSPGEFVYRIREAVAARNARVVVIDSLNGLINAVPGEDFLVLQIRELLMYLNQLGVVTIMVLEQAGFIGPMKSPVDLSFLADNVLLLCYFEAGGQVRKAVSVLKKRSGEHEYAIRELSMSGGRIAVGEPLRDFQGILTGVPVLVNGGNGRARDSGLNPSGQASR